MPIIRITSRPEGGAPEHIRDAWIGLTMPATENESRLADVVTLQAVRRTGGYAVKWEDAMQALSNKPEAREWWEGKTGLFSILVFSTCCCEIVSPVK